AAAGNHRRRDGDGIRSRLAVTGSSRPGVWELIEKRLLQGVVVLGCVVPLLGGGYGVLRGLAMIGISGGVGADSHFRYLSGLLLGIGFGFLSTVPRIET